MGRTWNRRAIEIPVDDLDLSEGSRYRNIEDDAIEANGVRLHVRCSDGGDRKLATVSLINVLTPGEGRVGLETATLFQTSLRITPHQGTRLVPKLSNRAHQDAKSHADPDERSGSLLFRNVHEFAGRPYVFGDLGTRANP